MADKVKLAERYGASEQGNFYVVDTIGVPHPYCIDPRHIGHAADRFGGMLGEPAIRSAEMAGIHCATCKGKLSYDQHQQALLVACKTEAADQHGQANDEMRAYLLKCKALAIEDNYAGFAFMRTK
jgi:hypothetical protein